MQLTGGLPQRFADEMGALLGPNFPDEIGMAVSGGGDSMAMLHLAASWARVFGVSLKVVTVDHGLRDASAAEAKMVEEEAASLKLSHDTLRWTWDGSGNLQDAARTARLSLINEWRADCRHVLFAHTRDDQAETLLMRLARGSGVDGLSAMAAQRDLGGWAIVRPLLGVGREDLRHYLKTLRIPYVDDPTNNDDTFARVRMRKLIGSEGLSVDTLAETAARLGDAREALERRALEAADALEVRDSATLGSVVFQRDGFASFDKETQLRLLAAALQYVAQSPYRPRYAPLDDLLQRLLGGGTATLHGGQVSAKGGNIYVYRELSAIESAPLAVECPLIWDGRFDVSFNNISGVGVRPLGRDGYAQIKPKPELDHPLPMLLAFPSLWANDELVACAALGFGPDYKVEQRGDVRNFLLTRLTH